MTSFRDGKYGLTFDRVNEVLSYEPDTGLFRWKKKISDKCPVGKIAGGYASSRHWRIRIDGYYYMAHRLAWLLVTGAWPATEIDHINRARADNRWSNLREATHSQNHANCGLRSDNTSGYKGVLYSKKNRKFQAVAHKGGKSYHAGFFDQPEDAHRAYVAKSRELHGSFHFDGVQ